MQAELAQEGAAALLDEFVRSKYAGLGLVPHTGWKMWAERLLWFLIDGGWLWLLAALATGAGNAIGWQTGIVALDPLCASFLGCAAAVAAGSQLLGVAGRSC